MSTFDRYKRGNFQVNPELLTFNGIDASTGKYLLPPATALTDAVFYIGFDKHVHEMLFHSGAWTGHDLASEFGVPKPGFGSTLAACVSPVTKVEELFFVNSNGTNYRSPTATQPTWTTANLFSGTVRAPVHADSRSPLITFGSLTDPRIEELCYVGIDRRIHESSTWGAVLPRPES
jgi:hypothetical protein